MYKILYYYVKPKYGESKIFIVYIKTDDIYKDIAEGVEKRIGISNYELNRTLLKGGNKKVIGVMIDELSGKMMKEFIRL